jgi:hypothetical protein
MNLESFDDVVTAIRKNRGRKFHLLLGNGFSIAYDSKIFSYNALHEFIKDMKDPDLAKVLDVIESRNFEVIMQQLDSLSALITAFREDSPIKKRIDAASQKLKQGLLEAVKALHPEHVFTIPEARSAACSQFLKLFLETGAGIYSTNYDLLLYWVLMRNGILEHGDGCGRELENPEEIATGEEEQWSDELIWGKNRETQNVFYLHGALPFFDDGVNVIKETYDEYNYLLQKIGGRMDQGDYPIFVTAGDGTQKLKHIMHNRYLTFCYESLCNIDGSLVTFGFNFGPYDEHIIAAINRAANFGRPHAKKLRSIYIGVYSPSDRKHIEEIAGRFRCKIHIFDATTADVWGDAAA